jgi:diaminohydroxyphosphoribosylaminopyrimidine deaminase / 5-amino-6-(5-phosphoribosylamino)uracil reductase
VGFSIFLVIMELQEALKWMRHAMALAHRAVGSSRPNPAVGAVVVRHGVLVGEGFTSPPGGPHAEVVALRQAGEQARGADMYVTLEPCCHFGRTPPCTMAIQAAGIQRVFYAHNDPNPQVNGKSRLILEEAGIEVFSGLGADEASEFYRAYDWYTATGLVFVDVKLAQSLDGFIAGPAGQRTQITDATTAQTVHSFRARCDAILVGGGTANLDNPSLTVRAVEGNNPLRILLNGSRELNPKLHLFHDHQAPVRVYSIEPQPALQGLADVRLLPSKSFRANWLYLMNDLSQEGMHHLLVEAGATMAQNLLPLGAFNRFFLWTAPLRLSQGLSWDKGFALDWNKRLQLSRFEAPATDFLAVFENVYWNHTSHRHDRRS